jgi:hypothetical protein
VDCCGLGPKTEPDAQGLSYLHFALTALETRLLWADFCFRVGRHDRVESTLPWKIKIWIFPLETVGMGSSQKSGFCILVLHAGSAVPHRSERGFCGRGEKGRMGNVIRLIFSSFRLSFAAFHWVIVSRREDPSFLSTCRSIYELMFVRAYLFDLCDSIYGFDMMVLSHCFADFPASPAYPNGTMRPWCGESSRNEANKSPELA